MGDVKTIAWTGMLAGWQGPTALLAAAGPFVIQAPIALALLVTKRVSRGSTLAFGPPRSPPVCLPSRSPHDKT